MDKRTVGAIAVTVILLITAFILSLFQAEDLPTASKTPDNQTGSTSAVTTTSPQTTSTVSAPIYIMGVWENKLALFIPPATSPDRVYDVYLTSLPEEEQQRLQEGIEIFDERELASLLEDYTS